MENQPLLKQGPRGSGTDFAGQDHHDFGGGDVARARSGGGSQAYSSAAVFAVFFFPALGGLLFGYDIGATSSVLTQLESSTLSDVSWYNVVASSTLLQGIITSNGVLGAMIGSIICFKVGDALGRRREILVAALLFFFGAIVEAVSGSSVWSGDWGLVVLMIGRVSYGVGCGFAMHGAPAYIGEMSPAAVRGLLVSLKEAMIVVGMLFGYSIGWYLEDTVAGWRYTYGAGAFPAVIMFAGMFLMPPSARWLVFSGKMDEARESLQFVTPGISELAVAEIQASAEKSQREGEGNVGFEALWSPTCKQALIVGLSLVTGQPSVLYYADTIFEDVGLDSSASVLVAAFKLVATLCAVFTVDKHGRVKLLNIGCMLMLFALIALTIAFMFDYVSDEDCNDYTTDSTCSAYSDKCEWDTSCTCDSTSTSTSSTSSSSGCTCCGVAGLDTQKACILAAMFVYIGGYQVGFGPVVWLIISEIFPLDVRGKAISVAVVANFGFNLLVTFIFPTMLEGLGSSWTFAIFAVADVYSLYFIKTRVPETKGLSLEQIEALFLRRGQRNTRAALA
ncbi:unnamed protein product [Ectocarpus sp. CCAP 1310/34]|nr:unnamed protein product [Ectocarpus sp. CCAP 1310/34]